MDRIATSQETDVAPLPSLPSLIEALSTSPCHSPCSSPRLVELSLGSDASAASDDSGASAHEDATDAMDGKDCVHPSPSYNELLGF